MYKSWKKFEPKVVSFLSPFEDEVVHVIKAGKVGHYFVVYDDAYDNTGGDIEIMNEKEVFKKFGDISQPIYDFKKIQRFAWEISTPNVVDSIYRDIRNQRTEDLENKVQILNTLISGCTKILKRVAGELVHLQGK